MRKLLNSGILGAADQALLSVFNLGIGLLFIHAAAKQEYAHYVLIFAGLMLIQSLHNAVVTSPLTTLHSSRSDPVQQSNIDAAARVLQRWMMMSVVVVATLEFGLESVGFGLLGTHVNPLCVGLAALGLLSREYARTQCYLRLRPGYALLTDSVYVLLSAVWLLAVWYSDHVSADAVLAGIGVAGILIAPISARNLNNAGAGTAVADVRSVLPEFWSCIKWALPSVVVTWAYANAFIYLIDMYMGKEAVADVSASRLLIMPISLLVTGWAAAFRPRAGRLLALRQTGQIDKAMRWSAASFMVVGAMYGAILAVLYPLAITRFLGEKYGGLELLAAAWLLFFTVTAVRSVGMAAMLASKFSFRPLFLYGVATLLVALLCCTVAARSGTSEYVILGLTVAEVFLGTIIWLKGWPGIRKSITMQPSAR